MTRTALVTGVAGQDGVYLSRLLLAEGTRVVGTTRPGSESAARMAPYLHGVTLEHCDLTDTEGFAKLLETYRPDEIYNLAGLTSVAQSWQEPELTERTVADAVEGMLRAVADADGTSRFFQASSAEQLGEAAASPYARAKTRAQETTRAYRDAGVYACSGILFAHESPLRRERFVTRKISATVAAIAHGRAHELTLGNLEVRRDWGHARDHVAAMVAMLRRDDPIDLSIGTGTATALRDLVVAAFAAVGIDDPFRYVRLDPALVRPLDADILVADVVPAHEALGWTSSTGALETITGMVAVDLRRIETGVEESESYLAHG